VGLLLFVQGSGGFILIFFSGSARDGRFKNNVFIYFQGQVIYIRVNIAKNRKVRRWLA
jgi:hypothetical protein